jgi:hypothetical protein
MRFGGCSMDIHKPKPWHGWREFLGEIGIIVIGVLIALAGEQAVEGIHWVHLTHETEQTLNSEIQGSLNDVAERISLDNCLRAQLSALRTNALSPSAPALSPSPESRRAVLDLYETPWRAWTRGSWQAAAASNALNHIDPARLIQYAGAYKAIEDIDGIVRRERDAKGTLAPLLLGHLTRAETGHVLSTLTDLDRDRADILVAGRDLNESARWLGIGSGRENDADVGAFRKRVQICAGANGH